MKYLVLILVAALATMYLRVQTTELGKGMYFEGCSDASLKLKKVGKIEESAMIERFCKDRKQALDEFVKPFEN